MLLTISLFITITFTILNFFALVWVLPMRKSLMKLRENELSHIEAALLRLEDKLDKHIHFHAEGRFK